MGDIKNATIDSTRIFRAHGCLTTHIRLDYGGSSQCFGGYNMEKPPGFAARFFNRVLEVFEVESWEDLKGLNVRADTDYNKVHRIGHFLKDKWVNLDELMRQGDDEDEDEDDG